MNMQISREVQTLLKYANEAGYDFTTAAELHYEETDELIEYDPNLEAEFDAILVMPYIQELEDFGPPLSRGPEPISGSPES